MDFIQNFKKELLNHPEPDFDEMTMDLFRFQSSHNPIYQKYLGFLRKKSAQIDSLEQIPFMPIEFFKYHPIVSTPAKAQKVFESSGTTALDTSKHFVADVEFYQLLSKKIFEQFYGKLSDFHILALLPSYLERNNSSLVAMVAYFIEQSNSPYSGFFLNEVADLIAKLQFLQNLPENTPQKRKTLLIGVTFALLDLAEKYPMDLSQVIVMETGGMKGRREELIREEIHQILKKQWKLSQINSEYGMTELLSQAYSQKDEIFIPPFSMKILLRDTSDPFFIGSTLKSGAINIIDLGNVESCAFIATQDIGMMLENGHFKVLGRMDNSDVRGCNLLVA